MHRDIYCCMQTSCSFKRWRVGSFLYYFFDFSARYMQYIFLIQFDYLSFSVSWSSMKLYMITMFSLMLYNLYGMILYTIGFNFFKKWFKSDSHLPITDRYWQVWCSIQLTCTIKANVVCWHCIIGCQNNLKSTISQNWTEHIWCPLVKSKLDLKVFFFCYW